MTLKEIMDEITARDEKDKTTSILAVIYDNYRVIGTIKEITNAIENYKKNNDVDLASKDVTYKLDGSAYGPVQQATVCWIDNREEKETTDAPSTEASTAETDSQE